MSQVVIFGIGRWAELAHFYLTHDSPHEVVGFSVDREYLGDAEFMDLPVYAFEEIEQSVSPADVAMFLPISFKRMNHVRAEHVVAAKRKGFEVISYVSSRATTFADFNCGENCFILEDNTIQPYVTIGDNVVMWSGNHIGHHTSIGDHVMITSQVVVSGGCSVGPNSFIGVNATIRDETIIGRETLIGAGVTIMADTEPFSVYKHSGTQPASFRSNEVRSISHKSGG
jgi:sugar O-acyltransferase (sialic acid O-acetyltransferase NeuD family)